MGARERSCHGAAPLHPRQAGGQVLLQDHVLRALQIHHGQARLKPEVQFEGYAARGACTQSRTRCALTSTMLLLCRVASAHSHVQAGAWCDLPSRRFCCSLLSLSRSWAVRGTYGPAHLGRCTGSWGVWLALLSPLALLTPHCLVLVLFSA